MVQSFLHQTPGPVFFTDVFDLKHESSRLLLFRKYLYGDLIAKDHRLSPENRLKVNYNERVSQRQYICLHHFVSVFFPNLLLIEMKARTRSLWVCKKRIETENP